MRRSVRAALAGVLVAAVLGALRPAVAHEPTPEAAAATDRMARAAADWLRSLGGNASRARIPFADANRRDWHFVPRARRGLALREMTAPQREAATALVRATLSERGVERVQGTFALEEVLRDLEGSPRFRDPGNYAFTVFGEPAAFPWGWRVEGHHLSVNVSVSARGHVSLTPFFTGSHPAVVPAGFPRAGERPQGRERDLALALVAALDASQRAAARLAERSLGNVVAGPGRAQAMERPEGLLASSMTPAQRESLLRLVDAYVGLAADAFARPYAALVREGLDRTRFAWAGGTRPGGPLYYRVHGPRIWIEYDDTQNGGNHVHALWRDPANDFGRDDLREHYREHHGR